MRAVLVVIFIIFTACSTSTTAHHAKKTQLPKYKPKSKNYITTALYKEYKKWYKTPYRYGGYNKNGIDCSSLIQRVYKDAFNIDIPRTTKQQAKVGYRVSKNSSKEGDLIFFKTGFSSRHSGIIIEKGRFIHASTKYGVCISHINNPYWRDKYWQTRRLLP